MSTCHCANPGCFKAGRCLGVQGKAEQPCFPLPAEDPSRFLTCPAIWSSSFPTTEDGHTVADVKLAKKAALNLGMSYEPSDEWSNEQFMSLIRKILRRVGEQPKPKKRIKRG